VKDTFRDDFSIGGEMAHSMITKYQLAVEKSIQSMLELRYR
jgi:hypothetical protein